MYTEVISEIMSHLVQIVVLVLGTAITVATKYALDLLVAQKEATIEKIGVDKYNFIHSIASDIFYTVEQKYRNCSSIEKRRQFDRILSEKFPHLKTTDIEHFRESIVGEVNTLIKKSGVLERASDECTYQEPFLQEEEPHSNI